MKWLYAVYIFYWLSVVTAAVLAMLEGPLIPPEDFKKSIEEVKSKTYLERLAQSLIDVALAAVFSYPGVFLAASLYGVMTIALLDAYGLSNAIVYMAFVNVYLYILYQVARWHPAALWIQRRKINWKMYALWLLAAVSVAGVLSV